MKIMITGSRGQLGLELEQQFKSHNDYILIQTDLHNLDITDQKQVAALMEKETPDVVINCAAFTNVDGCEADEATAFKVNDIGAQNLSIAAFQTGAKMVQISTDYVFEGNALTPRREYDAINPQSCYGKSKAYAEQLVRETNPRHYVFRTAWLYGEGNNFVRTMLQLAQQQNELTVVNDQTGTPTSTVELARCIIEMIRTDKYGTYHATCEGFCSWYEFALKIFALSNIDIKVNPTTTATLKRLAPRPQYSVLDNFMLKVIGYNQFRHWEVALAEYLQQQRLV